MLTATQHRCPRLCWEPWRPPSNCSVRESADASDRRGLGDAGRRRGGDWPMTGSVPGVPGRPERQAVAVRQGCLIGRRARARIGSPQWHCQRCLRRTGSIIGGVSIRAGSCAGRHQLGSCSAGFEVPKLSRLLSGSLRCSRAGGHPWRRAARPGVRHRPLPRGPNCS